MSVEVVPALVAGLGGTVVMSLMMQMAGSMNLTDMPPMPLVAGSMVSADRSTATRIGAVIHYVMMGSVAFGLIYAAIFSYLGAVSLANGALIGLVHGLVVGLMVMPMMPVMHPRMTGSAAGSNAPVITLTDGKVSIAAPGLFGVKWGRMTPMGLIVGHVVFGVVVALLYSRLV